MSFSKDRNLPRDFQRSPSPGTSQTAVHQMGGLGPVFAPGPTPASGYSFLCGPELTPLTHSHAPTPGLLTFGLCLGGLQVLQLTQGKVDIEFQVRAGCAELHVSPGWDAGEWLGWYAGRRPFPFTSGSWFWRTLRGHSPGGCVGPLWQCGAVAPHLGRWIKYHHQQAPRGSVGWGSAMTVTSSQPGLDVSEPCQAFILLLFLLPTRPSASRSGTDLCLLRYPPGRKGMPLEGLG